MKNTQTNDSEDKKSKAWARRLSLATTLCMIPALVAAADLNGETLNAGTPGDCRQILPGTNASWQINGATTITANDPGPASLLTNSYNNPKTWTTGPPAIFPMMSMVGNLQIGIKSYQWKDPSGSAFACAPHSLNMVFMHPSGGAIPVAETDADSGAPTGIMLPPANYTSAPGPILSQASDGGRTGGNLCYDNSSHRMVEVDWTIQNSNFQGFNNQTQYYATLKNNEGTDIANDPMNKGAVMAVYLIQAADLGMSYELVQYAALNGPPGVPPTPSSSIFCLVGGIPNSQAALPQ